MKYLMFSLTFLINVNVVFGQQLVQNNKIWNVVECLNLGGCSTTSYKLSGDTTIDNLNYLKLFATADTTMINWNIIGAMREDNGNVFFNDFDNEAKLYDFNMAVADTFNTTIHGCTVRLIVSEKDTVTLLNGVRRLRYTFQNGEVWIAGIGSLYGLTHVGFNQCVIDLMYNLNCCYENNKQLIYKSTLYDNCFVNTLGIDKTIKNIHFSLNPNPFSNFTVLKFNYSNSQQYTLQIINSNGKVVKEINNISSGEIKITKQGLKTGFYFLRLFNKGKTIGSGKLLIR